MGRVDALSGNADAMMTVGDGKRGGWEMMPLSGELVPCCMADITQQRGRGGIFKRKSGARAVAQKFNSFVQEFPAGGG
jgi:hypothetical protein